MKALIALLLAGFASPALGQQTSAQTVADPVTAMACSPEHAAMGHCISAPASPPSSSSQAPTVECRPDHAAMGHCSLTVVPPPAPPPPSSPAACSREHAAMGHCAVPAIDPRVSPLPTAAASGPENAADAFYGSTAMAWARETLRREHGAVLAHKVLFDRLEAVAREGSDGFLLDGEAWYGGDIDKLWLKAELEGELENGVDDAEMQALWSHAIDPWFDLQAGIRYDARKGADRTYLAVGVQGLAPYWWEVDAAVYVSTKGEVTVRAQAEHDIRLTQDLILQPRAEVDLSLQGVPELRLGSGLTNAAIGARLRYQFAPTFAPYTGVEYDRALGDTANFLRTDGENPGGWNLVLGVRAWF